MIDLILITVYILVLIRVSYVLFKQYKKKGSLNTESILLYIGLIVFFVFMIYLRMT